MNKLFKIEFDPNRVFGLDLLRALAILFVAIGHGAYLLPKKLHWIISCFTFDGVSIFFVLSGFLIGGILIGSLESKGVNTNSVFRFWVRRWFRTLPNYFLFLFTLCFLHYNYTEDFSFRSVNRYFFFSQNIFTEHPSWFFPEAWSLSIEEWFYLILPPLIGVFTFIPNTSIRKSVLISCVTIIASVTIFRMYRYHVISINDISEWDLLYRKQVITRLDSLMFGVIGAYLKYYYFNIWTMHKFKLLLLGISLFAISQFVLPIFTTFDGFYSCVLSFTTTSVATLSLLPYLSELKTGRGILYKPITYISLISYSMYLLNLSVLQRWIIRNIHWEYFNISDSMAVILAYSTYWLLLISFSILIYKYFEVPMTSLRDKVKIR